MHDTHRGKEAPPSASSPSLSHPYCCTSTTQPCLDKRSTRRRTSNQNIKISLGRSFRERNKLLCKVVQTNRERSCARAFFVSFFCFHLQVIVLRRSPHVVVLLSPIPVHHLCLRQANQKPLASRARHADTTPNENQNTCLLALSPLSLPPCLCCCFCLRPCQAEPPHSQTKQPPLLCYSCCVMFVALPSLVVAAERFDNGVRSKGKGGWGGAGAIIHLCLLPLGLVLWSSTPKLYSVGRQAVGNGKYGRTNQRHESRATSNSLPCIMRYAVSVLVVCPKKRYSSVLVYIQKYSSIIHIPPPYTHK